MLKSIRLRNWRSHSDTHLQFRQGTNLLVGMMGAGKSSVLEAISFAFFGTFPALERRKMKLDDVVRLNEAAARVVLEFAWEDADYRIERTIERSKRGTSSGAEMFKGGFMLEHGSTAVTSAVEHITGVDYDLFTRAIYSEQNNIDYFLNLDPRKRKQELDALLGLDRFEDVRANIVTVMGRLETRRKAIEERFSREKLTELEIREKEQAAAVASGLEKLASVSASHNLKSSELAAIAATFEEMRRLRESFLNLDREVLTLSAQADSLKKELQAAVVDETAYAESKKRLAGLVAERTGLVEQAKSAGAHSAALSKEAGAIEARMKAASEGRVRMEHSRRELHHLLSGLAIQELQASQKEAEKSLLAAESERRSLERSIAETEELVAKLRPGLAECPLCASKLDDACAGHIRQEKKAFVEQKRKRMAELSSVAMTVKKDNDALLARIKAASLLSEKITVLERELSGTEGLPEKKVQLDSELSAVRAAQENLQKQSAGLAGSLEKLYVELNRMETLLARKKALLELEKRLADARAKREMMKFDEKSFEALRGSVDSLRLEANRLLSSKQALETQSKMAGDMLTLVRGELFTLKKMESDAVSLAKLEEELAIYRNAVMDTQISLRASLIDAINTAMNEVWPIFYPYRNYPSLRIAVTEKDYSFEVNDDGAWKSLETVASGGERASAALTLRVALAMVLTPKLSWLILDEPTHNLDAEAVELLSSALQAKVPQVVNQTFVITHEEGLMGSDFASSYRLSRDKEHNGDTKTETI